MEGVGSAQQKAEFLASLACKRCLDFTLSSIKLLGKDSSLLREGRAASQQNLCPLNKVRVLPLLSVKLKFTCTVKPNLCGQCGKGIEQRG